MIRTYFQMLVDEIAQEEAAESARAAALIASGQIVNGEQMLKAQRHRDAVGKMKQFAAWFTHGIPNGSSLRKCHLRGPLRPRRPRRRRILLRQPRQQPCAGNPAQRSLSSLLRRLRLGRHARTIPSLSPSRRPRCACAKPP